MTALFDKTHPPILSSAIRVSHIKVCRGEDRDEAYTSTKRGGYLRIDEVASSVGRDITVCSETEVWVKFALKGLVEVVNKALD